MKNFFLLAPGFLLSLSAFGQINESHNRIRIGDEIIKQQVEYVDPGASGSNCVWDFRQLKTINDEYTLSYRPAPLKDDSLYIMGYDTFLKEDVGSDELIVGVEHNTMYYYRQRANSLQLLGHENPVVKLQYLNPMQVISYPLGYGQSPVNNTYTTQGVYSSVDKIHTEGATELVADAYGKLLLPSGDTLNPVLRVKSVYTIGKTLDEPTNRMETYRWYTKGYRYPVFETIRNVSTTDETEVFSTAFYYPLQEHLYLDTDPDNLALLEEEWSLKDDKEAKPEDPTTKTVTLEDVMVCKVYPNPVTSYLNLEYELKTDANVTFLLFSIEGNPISTLKKGHQRTGSYTETIDFSSLQSRNYILRIMADNLFVNEVIIKK